MSSTETVNPPVSSFKKRRFSGVKVTNRFLPYEQLLEDSGFIEGRDWKYVESVPVADIGRNLDAQSRQAAASQERVNLLAVKMKAGLQLPPVTLWDSPKNGLVATDGNTRKSGAEKSGMTHLPAYILDSKLSIDKVVIASALANAGNGAPLNRSELERAAVVMSNDTWESDTIAKRLGITKRKVGDLLSARDFSIRCQKLDVEGEAVAKTCKRRLLSLGDDAVFVAAVELARDADLTPAILGPLVNEINKQTSEKARLGLIKGERAERQDQIEAVRVGRKATDPPAKQVVMILGRMLSLCSKYPDKATWVPFSAESREEWLEKAVEVRGCLDEFISACEERQ